MSQNYQSSHLITVNSATFKRNCANRQKLAHIMQFLAQLLQNAKFHQLIQTVLCHERRMMRLRGEKSTARDMLLVFPHVDSLFIVL